MINLTVPILNLRSSAIIVGAVIIGAYIIFGGPSDVRKKKKKDNVPGLANIGNSCFLNALVQSLASCPLFVSWLGSRRKDPAPPLVSALHDLLKVLNHDGNHRGDACAGEVMCALRGHGWVISSEEQDTHELFHALTATIDDELLHAVAMPSLLDISWMEKSTIHTSSLLGSGVVLKSDCWKPKKCQNCDDLTNTEKYEEIQNIGVSGTEKCEDIQENGILDTEKCGEEVQENGISGTEKENMNIIRNGTTCDVMEPYLENAEVVHAASTKRCTDESVCDNVGCEVNANTNGTLHDTGVSVSIQCCESVGNKDKKGAISCDSSNVEDSAVFTDQCSNIDNTSSSEENTLEKMVSQKIQAASKLFVNCTEEDPSHVEKGEVKRNLRSVPVTRAESDYKLEGIASTKKSQNDPHDSPFRGYLASQLQCTLCGYKNPAQWTSFESLSLSLPSLPWGEVTLQELLDSYITQEKVTDVTCEACTKVAGSNIKTAFTKQLTIGKLPNCLCFHIKRTVWMDNGSAVKRQDHVIFPEFLTMDPYTYVTSVNNQGLQSRLLGGSEVSFPSEVSSDFIGNTSQFQPSSVMSRNATSTEIDASPFFRVTRVRCEQLYRLKAVIVHVGDVFCGHFVTYRRGALGTRTRNRWFYTSDLTVREANLEEVRKANAYMILYEKVSE